MILSPTNYDRAVEMIKAKFCKPWHITGDGTCEALWAMYKQGIKP